MILVDTSVWVDHLRLGDKTLAGLLDAGRTLAHPFVIGELALGNLRRRELVLAFLQDLPQALVADNQEMLHFIDLHGLSGLGIGYVDAHLLAAAQLTGAHLWTRDRRLRSIAERSGLAAQLPR
jgi:predicted nucleic acid-binding protein